MKIIAFVALLSMATSIASAQDIAGQWAGYLEVPGAKLKLVFHIDQAEDGFTSTIDSPDQGAAGIPVATTSYEGSTLTLDVAAIQAKYTGDISGDTMKGTWSQSGQAFPLEMKKEQGEEEPKPEKRR